MLRKLAFRVIQVVVVLVLVTFGATALVSLVPGQPAYLVLGDYATPAAVAQFNKEYGFNLPLFTRYWHWLVDAFHGNLGMSIQDHAPVVSVLKQSLPPTVEIAIITLTVSTIVAIVFAMISVRKPSGLFDQTVTGIAAMLVSVPAFISAVLIVYVLALEVKLFPPNGWVPLTQDFGQNIRHVVLPVITLAATSTPLLMRVFRGDLVRILQSEYIASAGARGLPERYVMLRYAFRPASVSLLTISGIVFSYLLGGSIIVETFFNIPGIGLLTSAAMLGKDIPVVQGVVVMVACAYLTVNILVDIGQTMIDPRTRQRASADERGAEAECPTGHCGPATARRSSPFRRPCSLSAGQDVASSPPPSRSRRPGGAAVVRITATPSGCAPRPARVVSGTIDFVAANLNAPAVSEIEVRTNDFSRVMGERENLVQGLQGSFLADLGPGDYLVVCPGATVGRWPLVVATRG